jgi:exopolysaccharide biosynthesis predicted pyruvyltransferase EpsI
MQIKQFFSRTKSVKSNDFQQKLLQNDTTEPYRACSKPASVNTNLNAAFDQKAVRKFIKPCRAILTVQVHLVFKDDVRTANEISQFTKRQLQNLTRNWRRLQSRRRIIALLHIRACSFNLLIQHLVLRQCFQR